MGKDSLVYNNFMGRLFSFSDCINRENYGSLVEWIGMIGKNLLESFGDSSLWKVQCIFLKKTGQKKTDQDLIFESRSENKKVYFWVLDHFPMTNQIHRSQERPLRLQEDSLETLTRNSVNMPLGALSPK